MGVPLLKKIQVRRIEFLIQPFFVFGLAFQYGRLINRGVQKRTFTCKLMFAIKIQSLMEKNGEKFLDDHVFDICMP